MATYKQNSTDSAANTNQLDMTTLESSMRLITKDISRTNFFIRGVGRNCLGVLLGIMGITRRYINVRNSHRVSTSQFSDKSTVTEKEEKGKRDHSSRVQF